MLGRAPPRPGLAPGSSCRGGYSGPRPCEASGSSLHAQPPCFSGGPGGAARRSSYAVQGWATSLRPRKNSSGPIISSLLHRGPARSALGQPRCSRVPTGQLPHPPRAYPPPAPLRAGPPGPDPRPTALPGQAGLARGAAPGLTMAPRRPAAAPTAEVSLRPGQALARPSDVELPDPPLSRERRRELPGLARESRRCGMLGYVVDGAAAALRGAGWEL